MSCGKINRSYFLEYFYNLLSTRKIQTPHINLSYRLPRNRTIHCKLLRLLNYNKCHIIIFAVEAYSTHQSLCIFREPQAIKRLYHNSDIQPMLPTCSKLSIRKINSYNQTYP